MGGDFALGNGGVLTPQVNILCIIDRMDILLDVIENIFLGQTKPKTNRPSGDTIYEQSGYH